MRRAARLEAYRSPQIRWAVPNGVRGKTWSDDGQGGSTSPGGAGGRLPHSGTSKEASSEETGEPTGGALLVIFAPGGLEEMFMELGRLPADGITDPDVRAEIASRYDSLPV